jgi:phosphatidylserine/phosphatidylglycerophosphate/cardiolipin synthase-like enzyme
MKQPDTELLTGPELHRRVIQEAVLEAEKYVWIATANLKDMHVSLARGFRPILEVFDRMAAGGVTFRIIHSDLPSRPFRQTLERFPRLVAGALEFQICPRSHWKMVIVDGRCAYCGSANFTGAGLGARSEHKRNLEVGVFSGNTAWVKKLQSLFDDFWIGMCCERCALKRQCPDPIETG